MNSKRCILWGQNIVGSGSDIFRRLDPDFFEGRIRIYNQGRQNVRQRQDSRKEPWVKVSTTKNAYIVKWSWLSLRRDIRYKLDDSKSLKNKNGRTRSRYYIPLCSYQVFGGFTLSPSIRCTVNLRQILWFRIGTAPAASASLASRLLPPFWCFADFLFRILWIFCLMPWLHGLFTIWMS